MLLSESNVLLFFILVEDLLIIMLYTIHFNSNICILLLHFQDFLLLAHCNETIKVTHVHRVIPGLLEVHVQYFLLLFLQVLSPYDRLVTFLDYIHVVAI